MMGYWYLLFWWSICRHKSKVFFSSGLINLLCKTLCSSLQRTIVRMSQSSVRVLVHLCHNYTPWVSILIPVVKVGTAYDGCSRFHFPIRYYSPYFLRFLISCHLTVLLVWLYVEQREGADFQSSQT